VCACACACVRVRVQNSVYVCMCVRVRACFFLAMSWLLNGVHMCVRLCVCIRNGLVYSKQCGVCMCVCVCVCVYVCPLDLFGLQMVCVLFGLSMCMETASVECVRV